MPSQSGFSTANSDVSKEKLDVLQKKAAIRDVLATGIHDEIAGLIVCRAEDISHVNLFSLISRRDNFEREIAGLLSGKGRDVLFAVIDKTGSDASWFDLAKKEVIARLNGWTESYKGESQKKFSAYSLAAILTGAIGVGCLTWAGMEILSGLLDLFHKSDLVPGRAHAAQGDMGLGYCLPRRYCFTAYIRHPDIAFTHLLPPDCPDRTGQKDHHGRVNVRIHKDEERQDYNY